jgi:hypothetical protein
MAKVSPALAVAVTIAMIALASTRSDAHKPVTSPYTFAEDVLPIVREKCGACHTAGGVAPMSLLTHADAVPWGESIRAELMAGHMPPWQVDGPASRFRNVRGLTARELDVLLTWTKGGTPPGKAGAAAVSPAAASPADDRWPLGAPDAVLSMPSSVTLPATAQDRAEEIRLRTSFDRARVLRAVDLLPGTPAIVRSATVSVGAAAGPADAQDTLALWVPGDPPVPLAAGAGFLLPAGADLIVRIRYLKTWEYEHREMSDRSRVGLYFAGEPAETVRALGLRRGTTVVGEPVRALAVYPDPALANAQVRAVATRPDGSREELIAFRPRPGWARRYWFAEPVALPRGTRIEVTGMPDAELLPPGAPPQPPADLSKIRLTLDVVPGAAEPPRGAS